VATTYDDLLARLKRAGQEHLLTFWTELDEQTRHSFRNEIRQVDFDLIDRLTASGHKSQNWGDLARRAAPPEAIRLADRADQARAAAARRLGLQALADGHVGLVIVAGGQGTRLGFPHPKGMFPIGPISRAPCSKRRWRGLGRPAPRFRST